MSASHSNLATFDDRYTMRHVRILPHPIERVWESVTNAEQINVWLMPVTEIEPRLGGRCRFSWGGPASSADEWTVLAYEPPRRVRYGHAKSAIEFLLEPDGDGTRVTFLNLFSTEHGMEAMASEPGGGLPAGDDTPWRPGAVAGFHLAFDDLVRFLARDWSAERIAEDSARRVDLANAGAKEHFEEEGDAGPWHDLVEIYEKVLRETCPKGRSARYDRER
jgi:uncharacterized protein YndB with AHSA1/START domain